MQTAARPHRFRNRTLAVILLIAFALAGALLLHSCGHDEAFATKAAPAFRNAPLALRALPSEPRVWLNAEPISLRAIEPADVNQAILEALILIGGSTLAFIFFSPQRHKDSKRAGGGFASSCLRGKSALLLLGALALPGCAGLRSELPAGSYFEAKTGYSKEDGASGKATLHIPLATR